MTPLKLLSSLALALSLLGCGQRPGDTSPAPAPAVSASPAAAQDESSLRKARTLCLSDPAGNDVLDGEIRSLQKRAKALSGSADAWILLGRAWVKKARASFDPGYYLNVDRCAELALDIEQGNRAALSLRVLSSLNEHRFADAQRVSEEILARDAQDPVALGTLSDALLEQGRYDDALSAAQRMLDSRPDMASYGRGSYLRWLKGDVDGAKSLARKALVSGRDGRDPDAAAWTFVQAATLYWHGATTRAPTPSSPRPRAGSTATLRPSSAGPASPSDRARPTAPRRCSSKPGS